MSRFFLPLILIALGIVGILEQDAIYAQWTAMYPTEPAHRLALAHCADEDSWFNRFSAAARAACYQKYLIVSETRP